MVAQDHTQGHGPSTQTIRTTPTQIDATTNMYMYIVNTSKQLNKGKMLQPSVGHEMGTNENGQGGEQMPIPV